MSRGIKDHKITNLNINSPEVILEFKILVKHVLKRWRIFAIAGLIGGLVGIIFHHTHKAEFKSHLIFALDDEDGNGNSNSKNQTLRNLASQFGFKQDSEDEIFSGSNISSIMKSRRIIEASLLTVDTFNNTPYTLIEYYLQISGKRKSNPSNENINFPPGHLRDSFTYSQDSLLYVTFLEFGKKYITVKQINPALNFWVVSVLSNNENFTKAFTDVIVKNTNNYYFEIKTAKSRNLLNTFEKKAQTMKGNLNSSLSKMETLKDENLNPILSSGKVPVQKQQVNADVFGKGYTEMYKYMELARFQFLNKMPLMQIIDGADYPMQKIYFGKWKNIGLFSTFTILLVMTVMGIFYLFLGRGKSVHKVQKFKT